ncbi:hypothetical protein J2Z23_004093 [Lederbergia galactosidilyticus]|uniref:hypothetical protein n=1 Tax=Lederbergia galactosidilytica TaxID=217031 RepID=UPI001AE841F8|nr:hypothetical protein [Lederbergia galactosidilytica]MBP1917108.1 hypothetical protein [Lederbergia galactosidilytica]
MTIDKNNEKIREEVKLDIAKSLIDTLSVPFIAEKLDLDIEIVQDIKKDYVQNVNINKAKQEIREEVARSLVESLAVPFIASKVGVHMEKVMKYRQEYEQGLKK